MRRFIPLLLLAGLLLAACIAPAGPAGTATAPDSAAQPATPEVTVYRSPT